VNEGDPKTGFLRNHHVAAKREMGYTRSPEGRWGPRCATRKGPANDQVGVAYLNAKISTPAREDIQYRYRRDPGGVRLKRHGIGAPFGGGFGDRHAPDHENWSNPHLFDHFLRSSLDLARSRLPVVTWTRKNESRRQIARPSRGCECPLVGWPDRTSSLHLSEGTFACTSASLTRLVDLDLRTPVSERLSSELAHSVNRLIVWCVAPNVRIALPERRTNHG